MNTPKVYVHHPEIHHTRVIRTLYEADTPLSTRQILIRCGVIKGICSANRLLYSSLGSKLHYWVRMGFLEKTGMYRESRYTITFKGRAKYIAKGGEL